MARKSGFVRRQNVMVRETLWVAIVPTLTALGAASVAVLFGGFSGAALALRPFTVVRTRGLLHLASDQQAASEVQHVALGMSVVSEQALAIGVTAVPTPAADQDSDLFFVYEEIANVVTFQTAVGGYNEGQLLHYDSKAMRKVEQGSDVAIVVETMSTSFGASIVKSGRMLIKLH